MTNAALARRAEAAAARRAVLAHAQQSLDAQVRAARKLADCMEEAAAHVGEYLRAAERVAAALAGCARPYGGARVATPPVPSSRERAPRRIHWGAREAVQEALAEGPSTHAELVEATGLPPRVVSGALQGLRKDGLAHFKGGLWRP